MSAGMTKPPKNLWFCFDISNGDIGVKNYVWWFETRKKALAKIAKHKSNPDVYAKLVGPFKYHLSKT